MNRSQAHRRRLGSRGTSSIEFTLFAGVGVGILLCGIDFVNYARARLKLDEASNGTASLVSGYQQLYAGDFAGFFAAAQATVDGFTPNLDVTKTGGDTIITGIVNQNGTTKIAWQQPANALFASALGGVGATPTNLPDNYQLPSGSSLVAVEVYANVKPWILSKSFMDWFSGGYVNQATLGSIALFQPRSALLSQVNGGPRP